MCPLGVTLSTGVPPDTALAGICKDGVMRSAPSLPLRPEEADVGTVGAGGLSPRPPSGRTSRPEVPSPRPGR